jgi:hypothetical protein
MGVPSPARLEIVVNAARAAGLTPELRSTIGFTQGSANNPTGVTSSTVTSGQSTVSWIALMDTGGTSLESYIVQYSSDSGATWTTATTNAPVSDPDKPDSYTVSGLNSGLTYTFRVAAKNFKGGWALLH